MAKVSLSGMTVEALMDLRKRVDEMLLEHRAELQMQLERIGALDSPADALLYSVDAMSTRGQSGLTLQRPWRMMGALEAVNGLLLFGVSTAYVFAMMQVLWGRIQQIRRPATNARS